MEITISKRYLKIPVSYSGEVYHFKLSAGEGAEYSFDAANGSFQRSKGMDE